MIWGHDLLSIQICNNELLYYNTDHQLLCIAGYVGEVLWDDLTLTPHDLS